MSFRHVRWAGFGPGVEEGRYALDEEADAGAGVLLDGREGKLGLPVPGGLLDHCAHKQNDSMRKYVDGKARI